jgi:hypothetical protein
MQKDRDAREKDETGGAEIRDPSREKDVGRNAAGGNSGKDADVIDGHQHHNGASGNVNRTDS